MSCNNRNIRNIDTSIYTQTSSCCQDDCKVRIVERIVPYYVCPPRPQPPFPPIPPFPPEPEVPIVAPTTFEKLAQVPVKTSGRHTFRR